MGDIEDAPRLRELCERASKEYDQEKLLNLIRQINDLLEKRRRRPGEEEHESQARSAMLGRLVHAAAGQIRLNLEGRCDVPLSFSPTKPSAAEGGSRPLMKCLPGSGTPAAFDGRCQARPEPLAAQHQKTLPRRAST